MEQQKFRKKVMRIYYALSVFFGLLLLLSAGLVYISVNPSVLIPSPKTNNNVYVDIDPNRIENGIHLATGFKDDDGLQVVISQCTPCHSAKLVTQNRATKEGWISIIRWMQDTQKLWDLGANEDIVVSYLAKNYAPENTGRRAILTDIEWYELEN